MDGCRFSTFSDIDLITVEQYLQAQREERGLGATSSNNIGQAIRGFCRWMVQTGKATSTPLAGLRPLNTAVDRRHERRALEQHEVEALLGAAESGPDIVEVSGLERALVYALALTTGLRAGEIKRLEVRDLDLRRRSVTVRATSAKSRKEATLPLRDPRVVEDLRAHMSDRLPSSLVFSLPGPDPMMRTRG